VRANGSSPIVQSFTLMEMPMQVTRESFPTSVVDWEAIGLAHRSHGRFVEAIDAFETALSLGPIRFPSRGALLFCYARLGRVIPARVELEFLDTPESMICS